MEQEDISGGIRWYLGLFSMCVGFQSAWHPFEILHQTTEEKWRLCTPKLPSSVTGTHTNFARLKSRSPWFPGGSHSRFVHGDEIHRNFLTIIKNHSLQFFRRGLQHWLLWLSLMVHLPLRPSSSNTSTSSPNNYPVPKSGIQSSFWFTE